MTGLTTSRQIAPCYIRAKAPDKSTQGTTMPALNLDTDQDRIAERVNEPDTLFVACLCAEWCGTCREYRDAFDRLADKHPEICFAWIDIETHADRFDDLDVENFPTILIEDRCNDPVFRHGFAAGGHCRPDAVRSDRAARRQRRAQTAAGSGSRLNRRIFGRRALRHGRCEQCCSAFAAACPIY